MSNRRRIVERAAVPAPGSVTSRPAVKRDFLAAWGPGSDDVSGSWDRERQLREAAKASLAQTVTAAVAQDVADVEAFRIVAEGPDGEELADDPMVRAWNVAPNLQMNAEALRHHASSCFDFGGLFAWVVSPDGSTHSPFVGGSVEPQYAGPGSAFGDGSALYVTGYVIKDDGGKVIATYDQAGRWASGVGIKGSTLHIVGNIDPAHPLRYKGVVAIAGLTIDTAYYQAISTRNLMVNDGMPAGLVRVLDQGMSQTDINKIDRAMNSRLTDPRQRGRILTVGADIEFVQLGNGIAQTKGWTELDAALVDKLLAHWFMPEGRLGRGGARTYENQRVEMAGYYKRTPLARLRQIVAELNRAAVLRGRKVTYRIDTSSVPELNDDADSKTARARTLFEAGIGTLNEARKMVGLDDLGPDGDRFVWDVKPSPQAAPPAPGLPDDVDDDTQRAALPF